MKKLDQVLNIKYHWAIIKAIILCNLVSAAMGNKINNISYKIQ